MDSLRGMTQLRQLEKAEMPLGIKTCCNCLANVDVRLKHFIQAVRNLFSRSYFFVALTIKFILPIGH